MKSTARSFGSRPPFHGYRRPPDRPSLHPPLGHFNFVIELTVDSFRDGSRDGSFDVEALLSKLKVVPKKFCIYPNPRTGVRAKIFFQQWVDVMLDMVSLWTLRFSGAHPFVPRLVSDMVIPSDKIELRREIGALIVQHAENMRGCEAAMKWWKKFEMVDNDIKDLVMLLQKQNGIWEARKLINRKDMLVAERDLIVGRMDEFDAALDCICGYAEGEKERSGGDGSDVFLFKGEPDWARIHSLMLRECRRLSDSLPIYGFRRKLIRRIHSQQVTVLIGETGSGKSTQLVQFLVDSGIVADGSIVCTQPRKIAAYSLARRAAEETRGCHGGGSVICYPTYSSVQDFSPNIIYYTTDRCLLQHYMSGRKLPGISCIVIDEAHERSLDTDLLLAAVKKLLCLKPALRLVIMSATADSDRLSEYFAGSGTFHVSGRMFPIDIVYRPPSDCCPPPAPVSPYVSDVLRTVADIHEKEADGTVLAFLTSQAEVEYACETFSSPTAVTLPLHGKLFHEEQVCVFKDYPGKRKVIFSTNVAETSLTIPGVRFVVDSGMVKEARFDPGSGMNVLRVSRTSRSSADQRAGRAGRTEPGKCYRIYSKQEYMAMPAHQEPEIRRIHLGIVVLRVLTLGASDFWEFDFIDAPSSSSVDLAVRNLIQLGAVRRKKDGMLELTDDGRTLVRMGLEPHLGKLILLCHGSHLGMEGIVLASVMANSGSIFCRVGTDEEKLKADRYKVQFCHRDGDLFTLLSVYKKWLATPPAERNRWCWDNSINGKTMRRCRETVIELEHCLEHEVSFIIPSFWRWDPDIPTEHDRRLKAAILSSLSENVAMYSGSGRLGYEVVVSGSHVQLHPSCSLLSFAERPGWVVFGEVLSSSARYLTCVTAVDPDFFQKLSPPPSFDWDEMAIRRLEETEISGLGPVLLKKLCGRGNTGLTALLTRVRELCSDERIEFDVRVEDGTASLYSPVRSMAKAAQFVKGVIEIEHRLLVNECVCTKLYAVGQGEVQTPVALIGAGAGVCHLELDGRSLEVEVEVLDCGREGESLPFTDRDLLVFLEESTGGDICSVVRLGPVGQDRDEKAGSIRVTFLTPEAVEAAVGLDGVEFRGSTLRVGLFMGGSERRSSGFPAVSARVYWPRRRSHGFAIVRCHPDDVSVLVCDFCSAFPHVRCEPSDRFPGGLVMSGLDRDLSEEEIQQSMWAVARRRIIDFHLVRGDPEEGPPPAVCEEEILKEMSPFLGGRGLSRTCCTVEVFPPDPRAAFVRGLVKFDERLHLEAAKALEQIEGKTLPGCHSWQTIKCQRVFNSFLSCPARVYPVIKPQLDALLIRCRHRNGVECSLSRNPNGSYRVKLSANATKTVAELRRPFEELMKGKAVTDARLTPATLQYLFSRDRFPVLKDIERANETLILSDRHTHEVRIFGLADRIRRSEVQLVLSLLHLSDRRELEVRLRGPGLPPDLMKRVVQEFGPDLHVLRSRFPAAAFSLDTRLHRITMHGERDLKPRVEAAVLEVARAYVGPATPVAAGPEPCPICLCEFENRYRLESCGHSFCSPCLVEQCESAARNKDGFPIGCSHGGCGSPILVTDLRALLPPDRLEDLFHASVSAHVAASGGALRFCPSPDCPAVYRATGPGYGSGSGSGSVPFGCGACGVETCTECHLEYHPSVSCERYREFKEDPDLSLEEWARGRENVKRCPVCGNAIEKADGCNHVQCRCGNHICWSCLSVFGSSEECYAHLSSVHGSIT